jgi:lycopene cyclase domain-containing protein
MTYTIAALLGVGGAAVIDLAVLRTALLRRRAFWTAYAIMLFFQLVVNGLLTGLRIVRYDADAILGWRIAYAPVEDLLFGFALVLTTLSLWVRAGRRGGRPPLRVGRPAPPTPAAAPPPGPES